MAVRRARKTTKESRLFDRELSWLEWDARVLELAGDERTPLLERLRFTAIFSSNLDEFCMVRVAELLEAVRDAPTRPRTAGELLPSEVLDRVGSRMRELVERQVQVGAADAAHAHPHEHLARSRHRVGSFAGAERSLVDWLRKHDAVDALLE